MKEFRARLTGGILGGLGGLVGTAGAIAGGLELNHLMDPQKFMGPEESVFWVAPAAFGLVAGLIGAYTGQLIAEAKV